MGEGERRERALRGTRCAKTHPTEEMKSLLPKTMPNFLVWSIRHVEGRGTGENPALEEWFSGMFNSSTHPGVQLDKGQREGARMAQRQAPRGGLGAGISVIYLTAEMTEHL